jgi:hypothetical protein
MTRRVKKAKMIKKMLMKKFSKKIILRANKGAKMEAW